MPRYAQLPIPRNYFIAETSEGYYAGRLLPQDTGCTFLPFTRKIQDREQIIIYKRRYDAIQACIRHAAFHSTPTEMQTFRNETSTEDI